MTAASRSALTAEREPLWTTSSYGRTTDTTPMELEALGEHFAQCNGEGARRVAMHCGAQSMRGFVLARLFSVTAVVAALIGLAWLVF
jgi:hypothetical protein